MAKTYQQGLYIVLSLLFLQTGIIEQNPSNVLYFDGRSSLLSPPVVLPIALGLRLFYTVSMDAKKIKKLYLFTSVLILLAAVGITGYFVKTGLDKRNETSSPAVVESLPPKNETNSQTDSDYKLIIPKISLEAPIIINVDGNDKAGYNKALENGLAQMEGSALPGKNGNSFIFGHSSYFPDQPGNYKEVFAKLNELNPGDVFEVHTKSTKYIYSVTDKRIVQPNDVSVAAQNTALKQMTLMTCWPLGTTEKRLIVVGELVQS